ncbi:MAG: hypothetical protein JRD89_01490 [Deltaproteobacteria bacterium]|nr:hypothetical protein [Deltaproteobacteria bacterium]
MKTVTINSKKASILGLCTGESLMPGRNEIPVESFEIVKEDPTFKSWQKLGFVSVVAVAPAKAPAKPVDVEAPALTIEELCALTIKKATVILEKTDNREFLLDWHEAETRPKMQNAIEVRVEGLE